MTKNTMLLGDAKSGKSTVLDNIISSYKNSRMVFKKYLGRYDSEYKHINKYLLSKYRETDKQLINKDEHY